MSKVSLKGLTIFTKGGKKTQNTKFIDTSTHIKLKEYYKYEGTKGRTIHVYDLPIRMKKHSNIIVSEIYQRENKNKKNPQHNEIS